MAAYQIGDISERLALSVDTLRYYEKIGLLPPVTRNTSGLRVYNDKDISRLQFIQRAQKMNFTLAEIADLLKMREAPRRARKSVREMTGSKLDEIERHLADLKTLRNELRLLLNLCGSSTEGCPIIAEIDKGDSSRRRKAQPGIRMNKSTTQE